MQRIRDGLFALVCGAVVMIGGFEYGRTSADGEPARPEAAKPPEEKPEPPAKEPVEERVLQLPEDADQWHTSLLLNDDWQQRPLDRSLFEAFQNDPRLLRLVAQTKYHTYHRSNPYYQQVLARAVPELPAVLVQRGDGSTVFKSSGVRLAEDLSDLGRSIALTIEQKCPGPACPAPKPLLPNPNPYHPDNLVAPVPPGIPDLGPASPASGLLDQFGLGNLGTQDLLLPLLVAVGAWLFARRK